MGGREGRREGQWYAPLDVAHQLPKDATVGVAEFGDQGLKEKNMKKGIGIEKKEGGEEGGGREGGAKVGLLTMSTETWGPRSLERRSRKMRARRTWPSWGAITVTRGCGPGREGGGKGGGEGGREGGSKG